jgi:hypothetical protein
VARRRRAWAATEAGPVVTRRFDAADSIKEDSVSVRLPASSSRVAGASGAGRAPAVPPTVAEGEGASAAMSGAVRTDSLQVPIGASGVTQPAIAGVSQGHVGRAYRAVANIHSWSPREGGAADKADAA